METLLDVREITYLDAEVLDAALGTHLRFGQQRYRAVAVKVISHDGGIPEDGLKFLIEQAKRDVKITREIPLSEVADFGILREIQKELGLR